MVRDGDPPAGPVRQDHRPRPGSARPRMAFMLLTRPDNLLAQLGVGRTLAGYWLRLRYRYSITPRP